MIVKEVAFGNQLEAYIEDRFTNGVNVIFSNDNNKGKTLVMQGLMYSIGYEAIFPSTFLFRNYYFYSKIEFNNITYKFLRKKNMIIVQENDFIQIFNSINEFKYYFSKNIFPLPRINKDKQNRMVDLNLFYEIFFIGQDNRSPDNLISKTQFNKKDFENMIYSYMDLSLLDVDEESIEEIKNKIKEKQLQKKKLDKLVKLKKDNPNIANIILKSQDKIQFNEKSEKIKKLYSDITTLKKARTRELNRKIKLEDLLVELTSISRKLDEGSVKCLECGSDKIVYSNNDIKFEISNNEVRQNILDSINKNIDIKNEIIDDYTFEINRIQELIQNQLNILLESIPSDHKDILLYQDEILNEKNNDEELYSIITDIQDLNDKLKQLNLNTENKKAEKQLLLKNILDEMTGIYKTINPQGILTFENIFAKKDATFSGSESQEFYFSKLIALNNILKHKFPLIVDSFRDGELSTDKENKMLKYYKLLNKQVILTATLKNEEYLANKYNTDKELNVLDYSSYQDSKILQEEYSDEFISIIKTFSITTV